MSNSFSCCRTVINENLIENATKDYKVNKESLDNQSKLFSLLGNEVRLKIIYLILKYKRLCVCDFVDILEVNQSPISQHLRKLKDTGILENQREGSAVYYFIKNSMKDKLEIILEV
ncbi:MAG: transcriptional regulator [Arcobacter sp.]|nr:MAG: transcriptional regulator [Arcobacter sp.]